MCGRMVLTRSAREIAEAFDVDDADAVLELAPSWNVAPTRDVPAVRAVDGGRRRLDALHWGLIPSWAKARDVGYRMINARAETAAEKPSFRTALRRRRCIVPADGFYEWQRPQGGASGRGAPPKVPHYIRATDGGLLAIAGLWEAWTDEETGEVVQSCTLLTTDANALLATIHDRMPVILAPGDWARWLDPKRTDPADVQDLLVPAPDDRLETWAVSTLVNSPRNDEPACIEPI